MAVSKPRARPFRGKRKVNVVWHARQSTESIVHIRKSTQHQAASRRLMPIRLTPDVEADCGPVNELDLGEVDVPSAALPAALSLSPCAPADSSAGVNSRLQSSPRASSSPAELVTTMARQENSGRAEGASVMVTFVVVHDVEAMVVVPRRVAVQVISCLRFIAGAVVVVDGVKSRRRAGVDDSSAALTWSVSLQLSPSSSEALFPSSVKVVAGHVNSGMGST